MDDLRRPQEALLFLCCSDEHCERFTSHLRSEMLHNEVHNVPEALDLVAEIEGRTSRGARALVVLDCTSESAWQGYEALRSSHLRTVPVLAICDACDVEAAYARGVNAVLPREHWQQNLARTASQMTSFWLRLVRLPATPTGGVVSS